MTHDSLHTRPVHRALLSVSDKTGLIEFARALHEAGVELVSTGGTAAAIAKAGLPVRQVDDLTGFPEMMDGRLKTLHPKVHGGILAIRSNAEHVKSMAEHGIAPIDLVCVNLYPFRETVAKPGVDLAHAIENIDIGGPTMVRAAAKNHHDVAIVTAPEQYAKVGAAVAAGGTNLALRRQLAAAAFSHTAAYDAAILAYLVPRFEQGDEAMFPGELAIGYQRVQVARYGENPHQRAAIYRDGAWRGPSVVSPACKQLHGKELSYNNVNDAAAALDLAIALGLQSGKPSAAIIKHANPCGAASAGTVEGAIDRAIAGDPLAAFGGILAVSHEIDEAAAKRLSGKETFLEVVIAPGYSPVALAILQAKSAGLRILACGPIDAAIVGSSRLTVRGFTGGLLVQEADTTPARPGSWEHKAGPAATPAMIDAACALEIMVRAMSSNAIAIGGVDAGGVGGGAVRLYGGGVGQVDRVTACKLAIAKSAAQGVNLANAAIAVSDAFFPFADGPTLLADAGVAMIVHPGGSKRDQETFDLCEARGICCMVTGVRRFRH